MDPGSITVIQNAVLQQIVTAFGTVGGYAANLVYLFAAFELVVFGLIWALHHNAMWERLFFKVLKIGLIFFVIQNYTYLVNTVLQSFVQIGGLMAAKKDLAQFIFNPAALWQFGYNQSMALLQAASLSSSIGFAMVQMVLGFGILLTIGLLGIQLIVQLAAFYLVSLTGLIMMPFGVFSPTSDMFSGAVQAVLKAAVRVMVMILIIGVAVSILHTTTGAVKAPTNINQPLGLFFASLLFLCLAIYLPKLAAQAVGRLDFRFAQEAAGAAPAAIQAVTVGGAGGVAPQTVGAMSSMQAATNISPVGAPAGSGFAAAPVGGPMSGATTVVTTSGGGAMAPGKLSADKSAPSALSKASITRQGLSEGALKQLRKTFREAIEEKEIADAHR